LFRLIAAKLLGCRELAASAIDLFTAGIAQGGWNSGLFKTTNKLVLYGWLRGGPD
jgi:hypothetical protein